MFGDGRLCVGARGGGPGRRLAGARPRLGGRLPSARGARRDGLDVRGPGTRGRRGGRPGDPRGLRRGRGGAARRARALGRRSRRSRSSWHWGPSGLGLAPALEGLSDGREVVRVTIPQADGAESLNVAAAGAALMVEAVRQRAGSPGPSGGGVSGSLTSR